MLLPSCSHLPVDVTYVVEADFVFPPSEGMHKPQNFGQYNSVGGESFLAHKCNVSFICLQSMSPLSTHVSIVVPVGGGSVDPSAENIKGPLS
jgi:hypothetical protein